MSEGACGVKVKYLSHEEVGAKRVQLRIFTIDVYGYTPLDRHKHEHEVFILRGKALTHGKGEVVVKAGDVLFISSWDEHQFRSIGEDKLQFLCTKETIP